MVQAAYIPRKRLTDFDRSAFFVSEKNDFVQYIYNFSNYVY